MRGWRLVEETQHIARAAIRRMAARCLAVEAELLVEDPLLPPARDPPLRSAWTTTWTVSGVLRTNINPTLSIEFIGYAGFLNM